MGLVISRNQGEAFTLIVEPSDQPTLINVEVHKIRGNKARLCTSADERKVKVVRNELLTKEQRQELKTLERSGQTPEQVAAAEDAFYRAAFGESLD